MKVPGLRSPYDKVRGIVFFGRTLDKIRLNARGMLPADYNRGFGFDGRVCRFLRVRYDALVVRTLQGGNDEEILEWCCVNGRRPNNEEVEVFNAFMTKRGWRDDVADWLVQQKELRGFGNREDIQTTFDFLVADEEN